MNQRIKVTGMVHMKIMYLSDAMSLDYNSIYIDN